MNEINMNKDELRDAELAKHQADAVVYERDDSLDGLSLLEQKSLLVSGSRRAALDHARS